MNDIQRPSKERDVFEKWLLERQGLTSAWNEERRCYEDFPAHLAWCAWRDSSSTHEPGLEVPILRNCLGNLYAAIQRTERFVGDADIKFAMREAAIALGPPYSTVTKGANDA